MEDIEELAKSKEYNSYNSVNTALSLIGQCLEPYTLQKLALVHQQVKQKAGVKLCNKECSKNLHHKRWCQICLTWKRELEVYLEDPGSQPNWRKLKSWKWPEDPLHIAEFFLPPNWKVTDINLKDISTTVNIWDRCTVFPHTLVKSIYPLRKLRNNMAHKHSVTQRITDAHKAAIFLRIFNTLKAPDVQAAITAYNELVQQLQNLEKNGMTTKYEILMKEFGEKLEMNLSDQGKRFEETMKTIMDKLVHYLKTFAFALIILIVGVATYHLYKRKGTSDIKDRDSYKYTKEGCLSEEPHMLFKEQSIPMYGYISKNTTLVGRRWFFESLNGHLNENNTRHGVMVIAGMGYGKTALVANMVCASSIEESNRIRRHLVAYYICRSDSLITKKKHIFIRRLASLFSHNIPGFSDKLRTNDKMCVEYYNSAVCNEDPNGCIHHCLISPLDKLPVPKQSYIVLIDALDECEDTNSHRNSDNDIAFLLRHNLYSIPEWIKFIITCRNVSYCMQLTSHLYTMDLRLSEHHNQEDLKTYSTIHGYNHNDAGAVNFLLASTNISFNTPEGKIPPLDIFYEKQFGRYFDHQYFECAAILEIICSSFETITEKTLQNIILNTGKITFAKYEETLKHLSNFIQYVGDKIHFWHASLKEWLLKTRSKFKIDVPRGHHYIADYLLKQIKSKHADVDIILLIMHASLAYKHSEKSILKFDKLNITSMIEKDIIKTVYPLHRLARDFDSYLGMNHLITQFQTLDILDQYNVTPVYLSASHGNLESLTSLYHAGANMNFRTQSFMNIVNLEEAARIALETHHWNYGILDIATQNGHLPVVKYIVEHLNYSLHKRNGMNLLPIHLACKLGNTEIVEYFYKHDILMVDSLCLYFAAERGHIELVSYLLQINMKDNCKPCGSQLQYIPKGKSRIQGRDMNTIHPEDYRRKYILYDDWNQIACETALHAAVRLNHIKIVNLLVNNNISTSAYHCFDRSGRTPLISALQYNRTEIVKEFFDSKLIKTDMKCGKRKSLADFSQLNIRERDILNSFICCTDCTIMHIAAYFDQLWFVDLLQNYNVSIMWNVRDESGCSPVHTAACLGSSFILEYLLENVKDEVIESKCNNGSTPLEIAAACTTFKSYSILLNSSKARRQYINRELKHSLVFKALQRSTADILAINAKDIQTNLCKILDSLLDYSLDLYLQNIYQQNILHVALMNGHFGIINRLMENSPDLSKELMTSFDNNSETPVQLAVSKLEDTENVLYITLANTSSEEYLSSKEYSISIALEFIEKYDLFSDTDIKTMLISLTSKNYGTITLRYLEKHPRHLGDHDFIYKVLVEDSTNVISPIVLINWLEYRVVNSKTPFMCVNNCEAIVRKCHLHTIALKHRQLSNFFNKGAIMFDFKLNHRYPDMLTNCYDKEGYNVLERAVQGRSPELITYLLNIGVKSNKPVEHLIWLAIVPFPSAKYTDYLTFIRPISNKLYVYEVLKKSNFRDRLKKVVTTSGYSEVPNILGYLNEDFGHIFLANETYKYIDIVVSTLIVKFRDHLKANSFCSKEQRNFSLVHIAAMHSMSLTLSNISKFYGKDILDCSNFHFITPLYLANALKQEAAKNLLNNMNLKPLYKNVDETNLVLEFYLAFLSKLYGKKYIRCVFSYNAVVPRNMYKIIKIWMCVRWVAKTLKDSLSVRISLLTMNLYNYLQLKHICTTKCKEFSFAIKDHERGSLNMFNILQIIRFQYKNKFVKSMNNYLLKIFQDFRSVIEENLADIQYDMSNQAIDYFDQSIFELEHNPGKHSYCPDFNGRMLSERQAWGLLRTHLRRTIYLLKIDILKEISHMFSQTLLFSDKTLKLSNFVPFYKNLPAYDYISEIERLPFFDNVYNWQCKLTGGQEDLIYEILKTVLFQKWVSQTDRIREEHVDRIRNVLQELP